MDIRLLLESHNPWWREPSVRRARHRPIRRDLQPQILERLRRREDRRALLLLGPRQVGKTTILEQSVDDLLDSGWPPRNLTYFDFSDDRLIGEVTARQVVETVPVGVDESRPQIFFFDEFHRAARWSLWLKQAVDCGIGRVVGTGSATSLLRTGGGESGLGRWDELRLDGLSFSEYLRLYLQISPECPPSIHPEALWRYLAVGGFPGHALNEDPVEVHRRLRTSIVEKAIFRNLAGVVNDPGRPRDLFVHLVQDSGGELVSTHRANDLEANRRTIERWVELLEGTFLLARLERRSERESKRVRSRPKLYAVDHGLVPAFTLSPDPLRDPDVQSRVFEAVVFRHLREAVGGEMAGLSYLHVEDSLEADFVIDHPRGPVVIEVTHGPRVTPKQIERLRAVAEILGAVRSVLIHGGMVEDRSVRAQDEDVIQLPLLRFLMTPQIAFPGEPAR